MTDFTKKISSLLILLALLALTSNVAATRGDEGQQPPEEQSLLQSIASWTTSKIYGIDKAKLLKALTVTILAIGAIYYLDRKFMAEAHEIAGPVETEPCAAFYCDKGLIDPNYLLDLLKRFLNITERQIESYDRQIEFLQDYLAPHGIK